MLVFFQAFIVICWLFTKLTFSKNSSGTVSDRVSNGLNPDQDHNVVWVLVWVQAVCKCYQLMAKLATSKERVKLWLPET